MRRRLPIIRDDPEGPGSFGAGCLYAVLGLPFAVLTAVMTGLALMALFKGSIEGVGIAVVGFGLAAFFGLLTGFCGVRLRYWYGTALARRLDRTMDREVGEAARSLSATSATAPTAVPTRLQAPNETPVQR